MLDTNNLAHIYVCIDCMQHLETGETQHGADRAPWALLPTADVSPDFGTRENEDDGTVSEYGMTDFGTTQCPACGSTRAGARFDYAVWSWGTDLKNLN